MKNKEKVTLKIFNQLNNQLLQKAKKSNVINHNLEKGLGNEVILRELLSDFLPKKYGVAKGKIINFEGKLSKQCDIIIYDTLNYPTLFIDENQNQIIPIEAVYLVYEVKTTLTSQIIKNAFEQLYSIYKISNRVDVSTNDFVEHCPPGLKIIGFNTQLSLKKIKKLFTDLNKKYIVEKNFYSFSKKSPSYAALTGQRFLVSSIVVLNEGDVYHMLDGRIVVGKWDRYTLGMELTSLTENFSEMKLIECRLYSYFNWLMISKKKDIEIWEKKQDKFEELLTKKLKQDKSAKIAGK